MDEETKTIRKRIKVSKKHVAELKDSVGSVSTKVDFQEIEIFLESTEQVLKQKKNTRKKFKRFLLVFSSLRQVLRFLMFSWAEVWKLFDFTDWGN
jgi:hypothetical protein